jgi:hypothetical protein
LSESDEEEETNNDTVTDPKQTLKGGLRIGSVVTQLPQPKVDGSGYQLMRMFKNRTVEKAKNTVLKKRIKARVSSAQDSRYRKQGYFARASLANLYFPLDSYGVKACQLAEEAHTTDEKWLRFLCFFGNN